MSKLIHWTGTFSIISGSLMIAYWYLYALVLPYQELSATFSILPLDKDWTWVNMLGVMGASLGLVGLFGMYLSIAETSSNWNFVAFLTAFLGTLFLCATLIWDTIIWPILARHDASLLDFNGPIYPNKLFLGFFITAGLLYAVGYLWFGIALYNSEYFPNLVGLILAIGAPLFGLGPLFGIHQVIPRSIGITLMGSAQIWIGFIMFNWKK